MVKKTKTRKIKAKKTRIKRARKKKMRVAQFHWGFPPIIGGVETHLSMILPEMHRNGLDVSLMTGSTEKAKARYKYKGVDIYRTPVMDLNWLYKRGLDGIEPELETVFEEFLKQSKPDIMHAHNAHYFSKAHAIMLKAFADELKIPLILTAHNVWDDILFIELTRDVGWSHIIAVSHFIKKELIGIGCDDREITVIHHGIDTYKYKPDLDTSEILKKYPQLKGRKIVFHPARIGLAKGCDTSIKALRIVKERFPDVIMVLAGSKNIIDWGETQQKDIAYLVSLVKTLDLEDNVLIDTYTLDEMAQIYALSQVCLYPSTSSEPFGLTMLEALATSRPMIVTNSGGMPEIIRDGINGFVVALRDFEELASRVTLLLTDDRLRRRFGYTGRQIVKSHYTKEIVTKNTIDIYHKAMTKSF